MASVLIRWWWGGEPDETNPLSNLSRRDIYIIQKTWAPIYTDSEKYGIELFKRLFQINPESQNFFKKIKDMDVDAYTNSHQFRAHVVNFMSFFNTAVINLNQPEVVMALMNKLGESHHRRRIEKIHFEELKEILMNFLQNDLKLKNEALNSWVKFINFIYTHIYKKIVEKT